MYLDNVLNTTLQADNIVMTITAISKAAFMIKVWSQGDDGDVPSAASVFGEDIATPDGVSARVPLREIPNELRLLVLSYLGIAYMELTILDRLAMNFPWCFRASSRGSSVTSSVCLP